MVNYNVNTAAQLKQINLLNYNLNISHQLQYKYNCSIPVEL
jgi:hypothetical protein